MFKTKRIHFICLIILLSACGGENNSANTASVEGLDSVSEINIIEHVRKPYFVGDINNDNQADTAYVIYDRTLSIDSAIEKDCVNKNCEVIITFNNNIPDLIIAQSLGISIQKTEDLNNDSANELLLFSEWFEGYWYYVYTWTFKNGTWKEIARTKAFLSEDKDFDNRIIKTGSQFYLTGDGWDDSKGAITERSVKIKIEK